MLIMWLFVQMIRLKVKMLFESSQFMLENKIIVILWSSCSSSASVFLKWKIDKPNTKMLRNSRIIEFVMNTFVLNKKKSLCYSKYLFYIAEDFFLCISVYHSLSLAPSISPSTLRDECTKAPGRICRVD